MIPTLEPVQNLKVCTTLNTDKKCILTYFFFIPFTQIINRVNKHYLQNSDGYGHFSLQKTVCKSFFNLFLRLLDNSTDLFDKIDF